MGREAESVHTFTHKPHKFAMEKEKVETVFGGWSK